MLSFIRFVVRVILMLVTLGLSERGRKSNRQPGGSNSLDARRGSTSMGSKWAK